MLSLLDDTGDGELRAIKRAAKQPACTLTAAEDASGSVRDAQTEAPTEPSVEPPPPRELVDSSAGEPAALTSDLT